MRLVARIRLVSEPCACVAMAADVALGFCSLIGSFFARQTQSTRPLMDGGGISLDPHQVLIPPLQFPVFHPHIG